MVFCSNKSKLWPLVLWQRSRSSGQQPPAIFWSIFEAGLRTGDGKACSSFLHLAYFLLRVWNAFMILSWVVLFVGSCSWSRKWTRKISGCWWGCRSHLWTCVVEWLERYSCSVYLESHRYYKPCSFKTFLFLTARDIQAWEYVPLGPFLGKSFSKNWISRL